jgi:hypothetical protein
MSNNQIYKKTKFEEIENVIYNSKQKINLSSSLIEKYKELIFIEDIKSNKDLFQIISPLSPQSKGPKQEKRIVDMLGGQKIKSTADKGDYVDKNGDFFEIKCSTPSKDGLVLNMVQIRLHQKIEYYMCFFIDDINYNNNFAFILSKEQMKTEVEKIGASAHGAKKKDKSFIEFSPLNKEYRITIKLYDINNKDTQR